VKLSQSLDSAARPSDATAPPLLAVDNLGVTAGLAPSRRTLVRDVTLLVRRGETHGIVGESGSGKSLTSRSIVGLLPAGLKAEGSIRFDGTELLGASERVLRGVRGARISLLLQDPFTMLNPLQTVATHIAESLPRRDKRSRSEIRREVVRRLAEVGLTAEVAERYPFQISGGMRQRVALAAALAGDPALLIADEPTTALDVTTQAEVLELLRNIQRRRQMALILVTHDLRVAFSVCDHVHVMYAGSVAERAPAADLRAEPKHPYSLGLMLAEPPVGHYVAELAAIPGTMPQADSAEERCAFAERCSWSDSQCTTQRPPLREIGPGRGSACLRLDEIGGELLDRARAVERADAKPAVSVGGEQILVLEDVVKTFRTTPLVGRRRETTALDGVGFCIAEGESVGVVGETGSGKTTIARSILGLTTPDSGSIRLAGVEAADRRTLSRAQRAGLYQLVQVVFQDPYASLNPSMTVGSALREVLSRRPGGGPPSGSEEIAQLLEQVGLPRTYAGRLPAALSGGERQRVAIARALAMQPKLLLCDEPVAALDVSAQAQVLGLLRQIRRESALSMLFITHDLAVVRQMTDRVVVLYQGKVVEMGDTEDILDKPQHEYTRRLIDSVPGG